MTEADKVRSALLDFAGRGIERPGAIYLGTKNMDRLAIDAPSSAGCLSIAVGGSHSGRLHFNGVPIFVVDENERLQVAGRVAGE